MVSNMGKYFSPGTKLRARLSWPPRPVPHPHLTPTVVMAQPTLSLQAAFSKGLSVPLPLPAD